MKSCVKTYLVQFMYGKGNGWALVSAPSFDLVEHIFRSKTTYKNAKVVNIKETKWLGNDMQLLAEGAVTTDALNPYDLAVNNGFTGTLNDFLKSLKGERGPVGPQGPQGPQGPKGEKGEADLSKVYSKEQIDSLLAKKQNTLIPGKDIFITGDVIDNEHNFFTNQEIQDVWDIIMDDN